MIISDKQNQLQVLRDFKNSKEGDTANAPVKEMMWFGEDIITINNINHSRNNFQKNKIHSINRSSGHYGNSSWTKSRRKGNKVLLILIIKKNILHCSIDP